MITQLAITTAVFLFFLSEGGIAAAAIVGTCWLAAVLTVEMMER